MKITSSEGSLTISPKTGKVLQIQANKGSYLFSIKKVDLTEYRLFYGTNTTMNDIDILDVCYWWYQYSPRASKKECTNYENACQSWRQETISLRPLTL